MQGSIRTLITGLHSTNTELKQQLKKEKQQKAFLSTQLSDVRLSVRAHKKELAKLERKFNKLKSLRKNRLVKMFRFN